MLLTDLVAPNAVIPALKVNGKKQALQELAARAAELTGQGERAMFEILMQREKLGSTGVGNGIAIPHGKLAKLDKLFGLFARLDRPIDFEALDGQPVDLVFLLLAPETAGADHLKALARVARLLRDPEVAHKLRESRDAEALYAVLTMEPTRRGLDKPSAAVARPSGLRRRRAARSVHADRFEFIAPGIGDRRLARIGDEIGVPSAACSANSFMPGLHLRRLRVERMHVFGIDLLHIRNLAPAQNGESLWRHDRIFNVGFVVGHVRYSFFHSSAPESVGSIVRSSQSRIYSCGVIEIVRARRCRLRTSQVDRQQAVLQVRPQNLHPVGQHEGALELAGGDAAVDELPGLVLGLPAADDELAFLDAHFELVEGKACDRERDAQTIRVAVIARNALDIVGGIAVRRLGDAVEHALDLVETQEETGWTKKASGTSQSPFKRL